MKTKLTLSVEESLVRQARQYAKEHNTSVSRIVSDHFAALTAPPDRNESLDELTPEIQALFGCLEGTDGDVEDYHRHLEEKYL